MIMMHREGEGEDGGGAVSVLVRRTASR